MSPDRQREPLKVLLDSSFLFIPSQFHIDIFEELANILNRSFEPVILSPTREELQKIAESKSPKLHQQASIALKLVQKCQEIEVEKRDNESHDDVIVRVASKTGYCVATNDKALRRRLRRRGVAVVYLRQRSHLAEEGLI